MNIIDEAVEAAAKVTYQGLYDDEAWEDLTPADRMPYEDQARAALEAAAPHMLARAWNEGYDYHRGITPDGLTGNPYGSRA